MLSFLLFKLDCDVIYSSRLVAAVLKVWVYGLRAQKNVTPFCFVSSVKLKLWKFVRTVATIIITETTKCTPAKIQQVCVWLDL